MKTIRILNRTGDTALVFDETEATAAQRAEAKRLFNEHVMKKLPAFQTKRADAKPDQKVTSFDQIEDNAEVLLVPAIVAG